MSESKFAEDEDAQVQKYEEKFMDAEDNKGESKFGDEEPEEEKEAEDEGTIQQASTIFGSDPIIGRLVEFWGNALSDDINTFFAEHCCEFDDSEEHKLIYTKLHKKYEKIVEGHLQDFRIQEDMTAEEMHRRIKNATEKNELADMVVGLVLCCADFACFVDIMKAKHREIRNAEETFCEAKVQEEKS